MAERTATFAGGCFWCLEPLFKELEGVISVESGYTGGSVPNPSYRDVCEGDTGHAEAVRIRFDPEVISYDELLDIFFHVHDPTTLNRQGADVGAQYRSAVFFHDEAQRAAAEAAKARAQRHWDRPIVTEITPASTWYPAEDYHQGYYEANATRNPYCAAVITPKLGKFRQAYAARLKRSAA